MNINGVWGDDEPCAGRMIIRSSSILCIIRLCTDRWSRRKVLLVYDSLSVGFALMLCCNTTGTESRRKSGTSERGRSGEEKVADEMVTSPQHIQVI